MPFSSGSKFGRYEILSPIGSGGMGQVYLARDSQLRRAVALKVLGSHVVTSREHRDRLRHEAQTASALNHPNILTVYEIGQVGDHAFIATEFVEGVTLRKRLVAGGLDAGNIIDIFSQVARALSAAEAAGVVHCDIKPDNIMLRNDGYVKVLDFGLAFVRDPLSIEEMSRPGVVRGTIQYMSPEQLKLEHLDSRSDIWSVGVVLYEALAGRPPFEGATIGELISAILGRDPAPIATVTGGHVPAPFARILERTLVRNRNERYQRVDELLADLKNVSMELQDSRFFKVGAAASAEEKTTELSISGSDPSLDQDLRPREAQHRSGNLPTELTPFVGRESEERSLTALIGRADVRLVTLTGPGGTGKTRLALHVARALAASFPDGAWIADLSNISDARLVPSAIAAALSINEAGGASVTDLLVERMRGRTMLVVLDNFEQVTAAASVVSRLIAGAATVRFLVTSRTRLRLAGENEFPVPPLSIPDESEFRREELERHSAVALFVQRAAAAKPDFELTKENAEQIAAICRHLDGLPLAIELAAARIRLLPPAAMLARIENRFSLLSGGPQDLPDRQRTMYGAIAWGHNLLDDAERVLFARVSVFAGGFTLEAAEEVCAAPGGDTLERLASLVDKSFVRQDAASDGEPRFSLLETIRDFGRDRLAESGETAAIREKHARCFARLAHQADEASKESQVAWLDILEREHQNMRLAIEWALEQHDAKEALHIAGSLWWFWYLRGHYTEGRRWLGKALAREATGELPASARALTGAGVMAFLQCDYDEATSLLDRSVELSRATGDQRNRAQALQFLGSIARERGDYDHAIDLHQFALTIFGDLGDSTGIARSLNYVGFSSWLKGDFERAATVCGETLATFNASRDGEGTSWSLLNLAAVALYQGNFENAMKLAKQSLAAARTSRFREGIAWALDILGKVSRHRGDLERGEAFLRLSLENHVELGDRWRTASVLEALAGYAVARGEAERAAKLFGAARAIRDQLRTPVPLAERPAVDADRETLETLAPAVDLEAADLVGRSWRLSEAVAFAQRKESC
ncbi:MAG: protein kinase domain-containing protein [Thermoanaerobaculia bacterium]